MFDIFCSDCKHREATDILADKDWGGWTCPECESKRTPAIYSRMWKDISEGKSSYNEALPQSDGDSNDLTTWPAWRKNEHSG